MDHRRIRDGSKLQDRGLNERHRSSLLEEDARLWIRIRGSCHSLILGGRTVADESSVTTTERSRHPQQHSRSNCPPAKLATVKPVGRNDQCPCRSGHRFKFCLSSIVVAELIHGAKQSPKPDKHIPATRNFCKKFQVVEFDEAAAEAFGDVRLQLESEGLTIGAYDMLIAAHAKSLGLICVTNDKGFRRVNGLAVEDWR
mgnify:CR=1 FL=1